MSRIFLRTAICSLGFLPALAGSSVSPGAGQEQRLSVYAGAPLRLFDPFSGDAVERFQRFLDAVPMQNHRPVPERIRRETSAAFALLRNAGGREPTYFVATYFDKTTLSPALEKRRTEIVARYGEDVLPQLTCPVFATHADTDVASMLSTASGLPAGYFRDSPGGRDRYHELFLLTEASHCGFLARLAENTHLLRQLPSSHAIRIFMEALGDHEATAAFRSLYGSESLVDESDVLEAARLMAMLLHKRTDAYSYIPGFRLAFRAHGPEQAGSQLGRITRSVDDARARFRQLTATVSHQPHGDRPLHLRELARAVESGLEKTGPAPIGDEIADRLLGQFPRAAAIVLGDVRVRDTPPPKAQRLLTLPGIFPLAQNTEKRHGASAAGS